MNSLFDKGNFQLIALTPPGYADASIALAASRAGHLGILDLEFTDDPKTAFELVRTLSGRAKNDCGIKLCGEDERFLSEVSRNIPSNISFVLCTQPVPGSLQKIVQTFHDQNRLVILEVTSLSAAMEGQSAGVDALIAKGNEAGGFVGEKTSYILLQQIVSKTQLPVIAQGGIGFHTAAACYAAGAAGVVLDAQLLLTRDAGLPEDVRRHIAAMSGTESRLFGANTDAPCRIYIRPGSACMEDARKAGLSSGNDGTGCRSRSVWRETIKRHLTWSDPKNLVCPLGQDVALAASFAGKYGSVGSILEAIKRGVNEHIEMANHFNILEKNSELATSHGTLYPVMQGPMARISDNAAFTARVAEGGALPFVALSQLSGPEIRILAQEVTATLGKRPWGVGILGFNREDLLKEQLEALSLFSPPFAIIAGGLPAQVSLLESRGTATYVHVPSPEILDIFLEAGIKRFIFEGSECGGHIGPRSSFVLWETMTEKLLQSLKHRPCDAYHIVYAGGIHDSRSALMAAVIAAPLAALGVRVGLQMGTAYLLTREIVDSGALLAEYQKKVLECLETSVLEFSPGHALRCCVTPFARNFEGKKRELLGQKVDGKKLSAALEQLIRGKARIAAKGLARNADKDHTDVKAPLVSVHCAVQHEEGLYMTGQLAALQNGIRTISELHEDVTVRASEKLHSLLPMEPSRSTVQAKPCDIAIIGMACVFPKAGDLRTYWANILNKVSGLTEIPPHRWDWRLYYDEDRQAKDKIYSKWGGFLDDMVFDPGRFGMPPKSVESIDPMQLMALEVARRTLADAGYEDREFDRETASVILGASGGAGDVGMQYGLRSELPRFQGQLPDEVAGRLPEWTEDTFAGILLNVVSGRIANRLNFGGVNFTTDAACASSLAALYQGVGELVSGRSNFVIAGGVDTAQGPFGYMCFSKTQALSPRGRSAAFDAGADGIVISEGIAMAALKRLEDAERDGDRIYAVIKGVGGSSDGKAKGLTAPLPAGQLLAMRRAYEQAGFGPDMVELFEAHGTGTVVGDTAELESTTTLLKEAGCGPRRAAIGSVKTLIGHTKAAAGIAGLIKTALALHHRILPPHPREDRPNPALERPDTPLYLADQTMPWLTGGNAPRRAAVSAFGFGGTNFHVVLEEYHDDRRQSWTAATGAQLLLWHGLDHDDLASGLIRTRHELEKGSEIRSVAFRLAGAYRAGGETIAIVAADTGECVTKIASALSYLQATSAVLPAGVYYGSADRDSKVAVLFPGQGSQYTGMTRELAIRFPVYSQTLSEADTFLSERFEKRFGKEVKLSDFIFPRGCYNDQARVAAEKALTGTDVAQPALGAVGAGLWKLMKWLGLDAHMLGGHSYGEFAALFAGGAIDLGALMSLSEARGRFIVDVLKNNGSDFGTMAAIKASRDYVEKVVAETAEVIVANHNAPRQCVISGSTAAIEQASARISRDGVSVVKIPVAAAFHSHFVEPARSALAELIENTEWSKPEIPVYSNTTGKRHDDETKVIKQVMTDHLVRPVEFVAQIEAMYRDGARVFLELGPKSVLTKLVGSILHDRPCTAVAIDGNGGGIDGFLHAVGQLICTGVSLDLHKLFEEPVLNDLKSTAHHKTAWLLNGSSARRAGEPVKHVGMTIDEPQRGRAVMQTNEAVPRSSEQNNESFTRRLTSRKYGFDKSTQGGRRQMSIDDETSVMASYFEMMKHFLETQDRVMSMYMSGVPGIRRPGARLQRPLPQSPVITAIPDGNHGSEDHRAPVRKEMQAPVNPEMPNCSATQVLQKRETAAELPRNDDPPRHAAKPADTVDREKLTAMLLAIIEEKTGYPPDMIGMNQHLEADLGIDSIKRVEIIGALLKALPPVYGQTLGKDLGSLNTQPTLGSVLDMIEKVKTGAGVPAPFDSAGVGSAACTSSHSFRHVVKPKREPIGDFAVKQLHTGCFVITRDRIGLAEKLSEQLQTHDCSVTILERDIVLDEDALNAWSLAFRDRSETVAGIIHLAQIGSDPLPADSPVAAWRRQLMINEKSFFILLHNLSDKLIDGAHILSASSLGGLFNRDTANQPGLSLQGGHVGLLKSLHQERPNLRVKAIDVDLQQTQAQIASCLMTELEIVGGRKEVGYPGGERTIFETVAEPFPMRTPGYAEGTGISEPVPALKQEKEGGSGGRAEVPEMKRNMVVLATGGLKGVTAELLRVFALPGNTLLLTGRSRIETDEPDDLKAFTNAEALREHFVSDVRSGRIRMTPAEIRAKVKSVLSAREMRNNLKDFKERGAAAEYYPVDVTDEDAMRNLFVGIYDKFGRISGVVHGAGIIEDKLLADKQSESWSRVVETKVLGLLQLQKFLKRESLDFFCVMSSVAGRYGNSGQSDYATANELMNRLCCQLSGNWGNTVKVRAFCWGPWGATKFGSGMVTEETRAKFAEKGVRLVTAEAGRRLFEDELIHTGPGTVEIVCGEGPWEQHEADLAGIQRLRQNADRPGPLLQDAKITALPQGNARIIFQLGKNHAYLSEHMIDNVPVLPAAAALELMSEAADSHLLTGQRIVEARDCRLLKGIELRKHDAEFEIVLGGSPSHVDSEACDVNVVIRSGDEDKARSHYSTSVRFAEKFPSSFKYSPKPHAEKKLSVDKAYNEWLFHGPKFRVIEDIMGMSEEGATALIRTTTPAEWLMNAGAGRRAWVFDPGIVDAAAQMALLWARAFRNESALPARFGRIVRYSSTLPESLTMSFQRIKSDEHHMVRADVFFTDKDRNVLMQIEGMECISSPELNRLGGTALPVHKQVQ